VNLVLLTLASYEYDVNKSVVTLCLGMNTIWNIISKVCYEMEHRDVTEARVMSKRFKQIVEGRCPLRYRMAVEPEMIPPDTRDNPPDDILILSAIAHVTIDKVRCRVDWASPTTLARGPSTCPASRGCRRWCKSDTASCRRT
jgi:hypothetical protein